MSITVNDLEINATLDQQAMTGILGGWHNHSRSVSYGNYASSGWSRWMNSGIPFMKKRFKNHYRTKYIKIRQHQRVWQRKAFISIGF